MGLLKLYQTPRREHDAAQQNTSKAGMGMAAFRVGMEIGRDRASMCMVDAQGGVQCRRLFSAASTPSPERFADTLCDHL